MDEHGMNVCLRVLGKEAQFRRTLADDVEKTKVDGEHERLFYRERARILRAEADQLDAGMLALMGVVKPKTENVPEVAGA